MLLLVARMQAFNNEKSVFSSSPPPLSIPLQVVEEEGEEEATMDRYVCVCVTAPSSCHAIHMHVRTYVHVELHRTSLRREVGRQTGLYTS